MSKHDDATGFRVVPARYQLDNGRETIDSIRDAAGDAFRRAIIAGCSIDDAVFAAHCILTGMKYQSRLGKKGPEDAEKIRWYEEMAAHVMTGSPDPRHVRPGFTGYQRSKGTP